MVSVLKKALLCLALALYVASAGAVESINDAGTWRTPPRIYVNDAGVWRQIVAVHVNDGGTWRRVHYTKPYSIGVGTCCSDQFYGFNRSQPFGTLTPDETFHGATVSVIQSNTQLFAEVDLGVTLVGVWPQNHFFGILVQCTNGTYRTFTSASATYSTVPDPGGFSFWSWDTNTPCFTSTSPSPREAILYK